MGRLGLDELEDPLGMSSAPIIALGAQAGVVDSLKALWTRSGIQVYDIQGAAIQSKLELLDAMAATLDFPDYFGRNWNAADECLRDMPWVSGQRVVLLVRDARRLMGNETVEFDIFLDVVTDAAELWRADGVQMKTVLTDCPGFELADFPVSLRELFQVVAV